MFFHSIRKIFSNPPTDRWISYFGLFLMASYGVAYSLLVTKGWYLALPTLGTTARIVLLIFIIDGIKGAIEALLPRRFVEAKETTGDVSIIVPSYNGAKVIGRTIEDLLRRFPAEQIIVVPNGCTDNTANIARSYGVRVIEFTNAMGKVRSMHAAIDHVRTRYTLIIDDDTLLGDALLPISVMSRQGYEGVAFRVLPIITNWLSRIQDYEYRKSMDIGKPFQNRSSTVQTISGAAGLFRTAELYKQTYVHTAEFSGEDLQRTLLIHAEPDRNGVVIADSVVYTEAPETLLQLFKQRTLGWNPGMYSNFWLFIKIIFARHTPLSLRLDAIYNGVLICSLDILRFFTFPILFLYPWLFAITYVAYLLLDIAPYLALGKDRPPLWVLLLYPLYGLFNFATRICAWLVFVYRRTAVWLSKATFLDDYKQVSLAIRSVTFSITALQALFLCAAMISLKYYGQHILTLSQTPSSTQIEIKRPQPRIIDLDALGADEIIIPHNQEDITENPIAISETN